MTDINIGAITESLNYKSDLDLGNTFPQLVDYIVEQQLPTAENNYTWYDLYKSGKVVQGGIIEASEPTSTSIVINLSVIMRDGNYSAFGNTAYQGNDAPKFGGGVLAQTTTTITVGHLNGYLNTWRVEGMSAGV